jgi:hypothetical protein
MWAHIFTFVDEIDLWGTCRQVSQALGADAEREFASNRLEHTCIQAVAHGFFVLSGIQYDVYISTTTTRFVYLSAEVCRAIYNFNTTAFQTTLSDKTGQRICKWVRRQAL